MANEKKLFLCLLSFRIRKHLIWIIGCDASGCLASNEFLRVFVMFFSNCSERQLLTLDIPMRCSRLSHRFVLVSSIRQGELLTAESLNRSIGNFSWFTTRLLSERKQKLSKWFAWKEKRFFHFSRHGRAFVYLLIILGVLFRQSHTSA